MASSEHPRTRLVEALNNPVRFSIVAALAPVVAVTVTLTLMFGDGGGLVTRTSCVPEGRIRDWRSDELIRKPLKACPLAASGSRRKSASIRRERSYWP